VHGASSIFAALVGNTFLEELIINGNRFGDSAVYHLLKVCISIVKGTTTTTHYHPH
jgi:hypothetical protein